MARWSTYRLTSEEPDLPDLSPALRDRLAQVLNGDEIQAALQELLAGAIHDRDFRVCGLGRCKWGGGWGRLAWRLGTIGRGE
jgi:hypothetical protein